MNNKNAINLDKMIGLACIAINESESNYKLLITRNEILEAKCINYDCVIKERDKLKFELDKAKQNDNQYVIMENDNLKYAFNKQLMDIRVETLSNYDVILNLVDRLKEELIIKDLKLSQVMDDMHSVKAENEEKNAILQLLQEKYSEMSNEFVDNDMGGILDYSQNNNELYEGKSLIAEHINHFEESNVVEVENYRLPTLIDIFLKMYSSKEYNLETINRHIEDQNQQLLKEIGEQKEWQKYLENENDNLYSEFKKYKDIQKMLMDKVSEYNNLKEDYSKMQYMNDELYKADAVSKLLIDKCKQQLTEKEIRCVDKDKLIETLKCNLTEQMNKFEQTNFMYNDEREKCLRIERYTKQMTEECTDLVHKKNIEIASIEDKYVTLKDHIDSCKAKVINLKHSITTLKYALNKKNKILQETLKKFNEQQTHTAQTSFIEQQNLNGIKEKETILLEHQKEIECLKQKHDLNITHLTSNLKNEIQDVKKNLELKNSKMILVKNIAYSQLKEASNIIQNLTTTITTQSLELNEMKSEIFKTHNVSRLLETIDRKSMKLEHTTDLLKKLTLENKAMKKLCQVRSERIQHLELKMVHIKKK